MPLQLNDKLSVEFTDKEFVDFVYVLATAADLKVAPTCTCTIAEWNDVLAKIGEADGPGINYVKTAPLIGKVNQTAQTVAQKQDQPQEPLAIAPNGPSEPARRPIKAAQGDIRGN